MTNLVAASCGSILWKGHSSGVPWKKESQKPDIKWKQLTIGEAEKDEEVPPLVAAAEDIKPATNIEQFEWDWKRHGSPARQDHLGELGNVE